MRQISYLTAWMSVGFVLICLISGIILLFAYYPDAAYESVLNLNKIPFGTFFRKLHYFSSELFLIFTLLHITLELFKFETEKISNFRYLAGVASMIAVFILMFSGYVLKGDLNGRSAAQVAFSLILNTPILDNFISLFRDFERFFWRFFVLHAVILPLILLYFLKIHAKKIFTEYFLIALGIAFMAISFVSMPDDLNPLVVTPEVSGPWFFGGGESLLVLGVNPALVVSLLAFPLVLLGASGFSKNASVRKALNFALVVWVVFYAYFCFI